MNQSEMIENLLEIGGPALLLQIISLYRQHVPEKLIRIPLELQSNRFKEVEYLAHSIKSSAGNLGLSSVYAAAQALEHCTARIQTQEDCQPLLKVLENAVSQSLLELHQIETQYNSCLNSDLL